MSFNLIKSALHGQSITGDITALPVNTDENRKPGDIIKNINDVHFGDLPKDWLDYDKKYINNQPHYGTIGETFEDTFIGIVNPGAAKKRIADRRRAYNNKQIQTARDITYLVKHGVIKDPGPVMLLSGMGGKIPLPATSPAFDLPGWWTPIPEGVQRTNEIKHWSAQQKFGYVKSGDYARYLMQGGEHIPELDYIQNQLVRNTHKNEINQAVENIDEVKNENDYMKNKINSAMGGDDSRPAQGTSEEDLSNRFRRILKLPAKRGVSNGPYPTSQYDTIAGVYRRGGREWLIDYLKNYPDATDEEIRAAWDIIYSRVKNARNDEHMGYVPGYAPAQPKPEAPQKDPETIIEGQRLSAEDIASLDTPEMRAKFDEEFSKHFIETQGRPPSKNEIDLAWDDIYKSVTINGIVPPIEGVIERVQRKSVEEMPPGTQTLPGGPGDPRRPGVIELPNDPPFKVTPIIPGEPNEEKEPDDDDDPNPPIPPFPEPRIPEKPQPESPRRPIPQPPRIPEGPTPRPPESPRRPRDEEDNDPGTTDVENDDGIGFLRPFFIQGGQHILMPTDIELLKEADDWAMFDIPVEENEDPENPMFKKDALNDMYRFYGRPLIKWNHMGDLYNGPVKHVKKTPSDKAAINQMHRSMNPAILPKTDMFRDPYNISLRETMGDSIPTNLSAGMNYIDQLYAQPDLAEVVMPTRLNKTFSYLDMQISRRHII